jgi:diketogulonate reductase-like aldo/keto reductase
MIERKIPKSGESIPVIGLGTWQTFDIGTPESERAPRAEVLRRFFAAGGRVIDSSPMYGRAEDVSGDLIAQLGARNKAFIATKVWVEGRTRGIAQMEDSFRLFKTDRIELMQIHNLLDWRTHLKTLREWKTQGRFRYIGITHYTSSALTDLARIIESEGDIDFVQFAYSIGVREPERRFLPLCTEKGVATIVNRPFEGGGLLRTIGKRPLPAWAAELDATSWAQLFLKFILGHPAVTCVIPATSKPEHISDNVLAGEGRLPDETMRQRIVAGVSR